MRKKNAAVVGAICALSTVFAGTAFAATANNVEQTISQDKQGQQDSFLLKGIDVRPDGLLRKRPAGLDKVFDEFLGKQVTMNDLNALRDKITSLYRQEGYSAATAYIPQQVISGGYIKINVLDGELQAINIRNNAHIQDKILAGKAALFKEGEVATSKKIEDVLYDINSIDGVVATGELLPGTRTGSTVLNIYADKAKPYRGMLYVDNYGSKSTGKYNYGMLNNFYNIDGYGTNISIDGLVSNKNMVNYVFDVNTLVKPYLSKSRIGLSIDRSSYELGNDFADLDADGHATTYKLYGKTSAYETMRHGLNYTYGFQFKDIHDKVGAFGLTTDKHAQSLFATISGHDRWQNRMVNFDFTATAGVHVNRSPYAIMLGQYNHSDGSFTKLEGNVNYYNMFDPRWTFKSNIKFQMLDKDIDSSEKMSMGGINGVRAYPSGEFSADYGILTQNTLGYRTGDPNLTLGVFFDAANATDKYSLGNKSLYGYGLEANYAKANDYFLQLTYARRIGLYDGATKDAHSKDRVWFLAGKMF